MNWMISTFVALLTGGLGLFVAGFVAAGCVHWYHISGFEGKSGYFMGAIAILGGTAAFFIGLVISRVIAATATPGFLKEVAFSLAMVLVMGSVAALISWLL